MTEMYYKDKNYTRNVSNDIIPTLDTIIWYQNGKEVLDNELMQELEFHYEAIIIDNLVPKIYI